MSGHFTQKPAGNPGQCLRQSEFHGGARGSGDVVVGFGPAGVDRRRAMQGVTQRFLIPPASIANHKQ